MIQTITVDTYHCLNCFSHVIYVPQINMYQNIAKLLTHPSISLNQINKKNVVIFLGKFLKLILYHFYKKLCINLKDNLNCFSRIYISHYETDILNVIYSLLLILNLSDNNYHLMFLKCFSFLL